MKPLVKVTSSVVLMALTLASCWRIIPAAHADDSSGRDIPPAFTPFEYLVGQWKGQATPKDSAQSFRGWPETHNWAWTFAAGKPTGLSVSIQGSKVLADGKLSFDAARKRYRLEGHAPKPDGGPIAFEGTLNASGKSLVLEQVSAPSGSGRAAGTGSIRLTIWPNSSFIRYTMAVDRKEPGAVLYNHAIEIGLTKEGESLAGGASAAEQPKCIVTGGAATMTVSYNGQTFPLCCTGCRDEFNENPEKYIKKASLIRKSAGAKKANAPAPARVSRFEDAFAGDVMDSPAKPKAGRSAKAAAKKPPANEAPKEDAEADASETKAPAKEAKKTPASAPATRAAGLLRIGQNLEKSGKPEAALGYYRRIIKEFADTPAARTARQRIKTIEKP
jgi:YHS domain-containing protein